MAEDTEIRREVWESCVPVSFVLADNEIFSALKPESVYLNLSRVSYLPLVTDKVRTYFNKFIDQDGSGEIWFEDDGVPVRWHYPIGVLVDLNSTSRSSPWRLTVHFRDFPEHDLIHLPTKESVESHFRSTVKEADCLKHRGSVVNSLQAHELRQLFNSLSTNRFDQFWVVNKKLMDHGADGFFRNIPFKIHRAGPSDTSPIQVLFKPNDDEGNRQRTLQELLCQVLGDDWESGCSSGYSVIIHGISVPLESPVQWISEHMSYPDNFLHICIINKTAV